MNSTLQKIPGIGDIPILGYLFRSKAAQKNQTELVVMITPRILQPGSIGVTSELPRMAEPVHAADSGRQAVPTPPPALPEMNRLQHLRRDERGMSFVFVGVGFLAFVAATTLAIDVGMFMTARSQAQTAADAGALAGATALVFNDYDDRSAGGPVVQSAIKTALFNDVMFSSVSVGPADVLFPIGPGGVSNRVRVNVYRTGGTQQPGADAHRPGVRCVVGGHQCDRNGRSLAGQRHDLREAVHDSRPLDREHRSAVDDRQHVRALRQQGGSAAQRGRVHPGWQRRLRGL